MILFSIFHFLENRDTFFKKFILFSIVSSCCANNYFNLNFLMGFLQEKLLSLNYKIIVFSIYVSIFVTFGNELCKTIKSIIIFSVRLLYFQIFAVNNRKSKS